MKFIYLLFTIFLTFISSFSQTYFVPDTLWTKSYGKINTDGEVGHYVEQTSDGGYIITGSIASRDSLSWQSYLWLLKTNERGDTVWTRTYEKDPGTFGLVVHQTEDGGFIVLGEYFGEGLWIIKTNSLGDSIWSKVYAGHGSDILQTDDGGYIITGSYYYDTLLLKIDGLGETLWRQTYDFGGVDYGSSIQITDDDSYIISGTTNGNELWLMKTNAAGRLIWKNNYGQCIMSYASIVKNPVQRVDDGGYILVSSKKDPSNSVDVWLIKTDENGDTLWTRTYGGNYSQYGTDIRQLADGGYIILGKLNVNSSPWFDNIWLIRTNDLGDTLWTRRYQNDIDDPISVNLTSDKGYTIVGSIQEWANGNSGFSNAGLIKVDEAGNALWTKYYGIGSSEGRAIKESSDKGFIAVGSTGSFGYGLSDVWLLKMNQLGDTLWTRTYGNQGEDYGYCLQPTHDGGYIIGGFTQADKSFRKGDAYLIKTNSIGEQIWSKSYGGQGWAVFYSVVQAIDDSYVLAGSTMEYGSDNRDAWIVKIDNYGDTLWTRTIGGVGDDRATCIKQISDSSFIITGWMAGVNNRSYIWLLHIDNHGNSIFEKTFNIRGKGTSVLQASDGGIILGGYDHIGQDRIVIIKTDDMGVLQWEKYINLVINEPQECEIIQTSEGGYIIICSNNLGVVLIKIEQHGKIKWARNLGGEKGYSVTQTFDKGYVALGRNSNFPSQLYLIRLEPDSLLMSVHAGENISHKFQLFQNYPNPFNPKTTIEFELPKKSEVTLKIYNIVGEEVTTLLSASLLSGSHSVEWDASNLASGVYLYRLRAEDYIETKKMILMR